ncbi:hypothetical protein Tco_0689821, partial [Tanacetum coccineum]
HNIHRRPQPPIHITADDYPLNNLKFVSKGEVDEVFRMPIPKDLITNAIRNLDYYKKYLEMAARKPRQLTTITGEEVVKKKEALKAGKSKQHAPAKQPKPVKKKTSKPTHSKKICKGKRSDHLVDEEDEEAPVGGVAIRERDLVITRKLLVVEGKGKGIVSDEQAAQSLPDLQKPKKQSIKDQYIFQRRTPVTQDVSTGPSTQPQDDTSTNVVHDTLSPADSTNDVETAADMEQLNSETGTKILNIEEEQGKEVSNTVALKRTTVKLDKGQAGSDPGKTPESQALSEIELVKEDQDGSTLDKLTTKEQVHIENPPSSSRTLSSMKNLEEAFTFGDQFLNDKSTEEESGKTNVKTEDESVVIIPIHQASSSVPLLSTPIINLSPPKPVSPLVQEPIIIATIATTTKTLLPPLPPPPQSTTDPDLSTCVSALEKRSANFEHNNKLQDKTTQDLLSRVYKMEHHDLYSKIDKQVKEVVKEAIYNALQAPLYERFRDLSEFQMKEILHDRIKAPSSSSKLKLASLSEQPVNDDPIPNDMYLSESEDTDTAHFLKIKTRPEWLKPIPEEETSETPEPDWIIPQNDLPETENN